MRKITIVVSALALIIIGGTHLYLKQELEKAFLKFVDHQNASGNHLKYTSFHTNFGFFQGTLTVKDFILETEKRWLDKAQVQGDLILKMTLLHPKTIVFSSKGPSQMVWESNMGTSPFKAQIQDFYGIVELNTSGKIEKINGTFEKSSLYRTLNGIDVWLARFDHVFLDLVKTYKKEEVHLDFKAHKGEINPDLHPVFGPTIETFGFKTHLIDVHADFPLKERLKTWYESTGVAEVESLKLKWGALDLESTGTLSVDEKLQPILALTAEIKDVKEVINALVHKKIISKKSVVFIMLALQALSEKKEGVDAQKFSLTLQNGDLFLGPIPLVRGLKIDWGS